MHRRKCFTPIEIKFIANTPESEVNLGKEFKMLPKNNCDYDFNENFELEHKAISNSCADYFLFCQRQKSRAHAGAARSCSTQPTNDLPNN